MRRNQTRFMRKESREKIMLNCYWIKYINVDCDL